MAAPEAVERSEEASGGMIVDGCGIAAVAVAAAAAAAAACLRRCGRSVAAAGGTLDAAVEAVVVVEDLRFCFASSWFARK